MMRFLRVPTARGATRKSSAEQDSKVGSRGAASSAQSQQARTWNTRAGFSHQIGRQGRSACRLALRLKQGWEPLPFIDSNLR